VIAALLATKPAAEWCALLEGTDACVAPVLSMREAPQHPHHRARGTFVEIGGIVQPGPTPRFSRTRPELPTAPQPAGQDTAQALADWGIAADRLAELRGARIIADARRD
jgi:alpha-methylacyl-CoA racemase